MTIRPGEPRDEEVLIRLRSALWPEEREDREAGRLIREITLFTSFGRLYRRTDETHHLTLHDPAAVEALLAEAGFRCERLKGYGRNEFLPGWHGFVARKVGAARDEGSEKAEGPYGRPGGADDGR